ncbi:hypothetical protein [Burkholderia pyrrocinia]|uniref:hypothetical protein n=1 Tax=Burkholderia pyrrocinia TaxID=60550 RepID=UPI002AB0ADBB|nr:hypothetical protein [Burkholderia pyrrocinia]
MRANPRRPAMESWCPAGTHATAAQVASLGNDPDRPNRCPDAQSASVDTDTPADRQRVIVPQPDSSLSPGVRIARLPTKDCEFRSPGRKARDSDVESQAHRRIRNEHGKASSMPSIPTNSFG